jgi:methanogenic corrinoid protein MtbC1
MRQALSPAKPDAPLALGGAVADDVYTIPSQMADLVLSDTGFRTINYGARTPSDLLADAAEEHNAALVWVSISVNLPKEQLRVAMQRLARRLADRSTPLIIGGRHSSDVRLREFPNVVMANSMGDLATFAKGMLLARRASH